MTHSLLLALVGFTRSDNLSSSGPAWTRNRTALGDDPVLDEGSVAGVFRRGRCAYVGGYQHAGDGKGGGQKEKTNQGGLGIVCCIGVLHGYRHEIAWMLIRCCLARRARPKTLRSKKSQPADLGICNVVLAAFDHG